MLMSIRNVIDKINIIYIYEFGDGSDWMLSEGLTHANRTFNLIKILLKVVYRWVKNILRLTLKRRVKKSPLKGLKKSL